jgi:hypothetical protein
MHPGQSYGSQAYSAVIFPPQMGWGDKGIKGPGEDVLTFQASLGVQRTSIPNYSIKPIY